MAEISHSEFIQSIRETANEFGFNLQFADDDPIITTAYEHELARSFLTEDEDYPHYVLLAILRLATTLPPQANLLEVKSESTSVDSSSSITIEAILQKCRQDLTEEQLKKLAYAVALDGNVANVQVLLSGKHPLFSKLCLNKELLFLKYIALSGKLVAIQYVLENIDALKLAVYESTLKGRNFFHRVASSGNLESIQYVLENKDKLGFYVNKQDNFGNNFFHYVAWSGKPKAIQYVLENKDDLGLKVNNPDVNGCNFFHYVAASGNLKAIQYVLENKDDLGLKVNNPDANGRNFFHYVAASGNPEAIQYVLENKDDLGLEVNKPDANGATFYHRVIASRNLKAIQYVLENKNEVNKPDANGRNFFHYVAASGYLEAIQYVLENKDDLGLEVNKPDTNGRNFFHHVALSGNFKVIRYVLECKKALGLDVNKSDNFGDNFFHCVADSGNLEAIQYVLVNRNTLGLDINQKDIFEGGFLNYAVWNCGPRAIEYVLKNKDKLDFKVSQKELGVGFLHSAVCFNNMEVVEWLFLNGFTYGIEIDPKDDWYSWLKFSVVNERIRNKAWAEAYYQASLFYASHEEKEWKGLLKECNKQLLAMVLSCVLQTLSPVQSNNANQEEKSIAPTSLVLRKQEAALRYFIDEWLSHFDPKNFQKKLEKECSQASVTSLIKQIPTILSHPSLLELIIKHKKDKQVSQYFLWVNHFITDPTERERLDALVVEAETALWFSKKNSGCTYQTLQVLVGHSPHAEVKQEEKVVEEEEEEEEEEEIELVLEEKASDTLREPRSRQSKFKPPLPHEQSQAPQLHIWVPPPDEERQERHRMGNKK